MIASKILRRIRSCNVHGTTIPRQQLRAISVVDTHVGMRVAASRARKPVPIDAALNALQPQSAKSIPDSERNAATDAKTHDAGAKCSLRTGVRFRPSRHVGGKVKAYAYDHLNDPNNLHAHMQVLDVGHAISPCTANDILDVSCHFCDISRSDHQRDSPMTEDLPPPQASEPSIVEHFRIEGLHGYRTISFDSDYAATVLIAKNGSGKTTLLAALDAFLKCQFSRLREIRFSRIVCRLRGVQQELVLRHEAIAQYVANQQIDVEARKLEIDSAKFYLFLEEYDLEPTRLHTDDDVGTIIRQKFGYTTASAKAHCDKLRDVLYGEIPDLAAAKQIIRSALINTEVVYLPTYRRVELAVSPTTTDRYGRARRSVVSGRRPGLYSGDIQFGLSDVVERLSELNQRIVIDSSLGYREISATIIKELIDGQLDRANPEQEEIPEKTELQLFFSRLKEDRRHRQYGPYFDVTIPDIEQIYSRSGSEIPQESNKFLRYFLGKLNTVVQSTREVESLVRDFISNCNKYLSSQDLSTTVTGAILHSDSPSPSNSDADGKLLTLSRRDLTISVQSLGAQRKIPLNSLSSGEKQMISLFAKLFLYPPKEKLILIDEPELSLSIDWQRQILVDIVSAPLCRQVLAITHSPFIFDNALEPFARSLNSLIETKPEEQTADDFEADSNEE